MFIQIQKCLIVIPLSLIILCILVGYVQMMFSIQSGIPKYKFKRKQVYRLWKEFRKYFKRNVEYDFTDLLVIIFHTVYYIMLMPYLYYICDSEYIKGKGNWWFIFLNLIIIFMQINFHVSMCAFYFSCAYLFRLCNRYKKIFLFFNFCIILFNLLNKQYFFTGKKNYLQRISNNFADEVPHANFYKSTRRDLNVIDIRNIFYVESEHVSFISSAVVKDQSYFLINKAFQNNKNIHTLIFHEHYHTVKNHMRISDYINFLLWTGFIFTAGIFSLFSENFIFYYAINALIFMRIKNILMKMMWFEFELQCDFHAFQICNHAYIHAIIELIKLKGRDPHWLSYFHALLIRTHPADFMRGNRIFAYFFN